MEYQVWNLFIDAFTGASQLFERLISGLPGAKTTIVWAIFVSLAMSLLIIPMRGAGSSDRARAGKVLHDRQKKSQ